jgi:alginate O-acetyltransferase complex protein AlgI
MLFNSFDFLCFLPIVTILFFLLPHQFRIFFLLLASCIFYCYFIPIYLLLLIFIIIIDYTAALNIEKNTLYKKYWLWGSIVANVGILIIFKYYNFFVSNINEQFGISISLLKIILPIGLSFHTFQAMAYTIEVYRGTIKAEKKIANYALYVLFFPQLVAGPIERPQNILPQLNIKQKFTPQNLLNGLRLIAWGFFKKLVIADRLSLIVDLVYKEPQNYTWYIVMATIFFFSIQIYCDFSGYTDIARGSAKIIGYDLMINFNRPLLSKSIRQFWQRWHISLSTWFRDYVYIPLGGNRDGDYKKYGYVFFVFILSGIWHGAGWNFVIWGAIHAFFLTLSLVIVKNFKRIHSTFSINFLQILIVNYIVAYAFVFFRNNSLSKAMDIIASSLNFKNNEKAILLSQFPGIGNFTFSFLVLFICFMFYFEEKALPNLSNMNKHAFWDTIWFVCIFICIIFFGIFTKESFIYFQF